MTSWVLWFFSLPTTVMCCLKLYYCQWLGPAPETILTMILPEVMGNDSLQLIVFNKSSHFKRNKSGIIKLSLLILLLSGAHLCYGHVCDLGTKSCVLNYCTIINPPEEINSSGSVEKYAFTVR